MYLKLWKPGRQTLTFCVTFRYFPCITLAYLLCFSRLMSVFAYFLVRICVEVDVDIVNTPPRLYVFVPTHPLQLFEISARLKLGSVPFSSFLLDIGNREHHREHHVKLWDGTKLLRLAESASSYITFYYSTNCNTIQIWSWCSRYPSSVGDGYPAIYVASYVGGKSEVKKCWQKGLKMLRAWKSSLLSICWIIKQLSCSILRNIVWF